MAPSILFGVALLAVLAVGHAENGYFCGSACIFPLPTNISQGQPGGMTGQDPPLVLDASSFQGTCSGPAKSCKDIVQPALSRMISRIFFRHLNATPAATLIGLRIVLQGSADLQQGVDESYHLSIPPLTLHDSSTEALLTAANQWGALRGIETFISSVGLASAGDHGWFPDRAAYVLQLWPPIHIHDEPKIAWRGLMIDTSRHYLSVSTILQAIDGMAMAKMNVLHWHILDNQGWPLCIESTMKVCEQYAFTDPWGTRAGYNRQDLVSVVSYATARGVRILPEIDLPGHISAPLCGAEPQLCVKGCAPDPSNSDWWKYLEAMVDELVDIFPEQFFHGGADEFKPSCWLEAPNVRTWMKSQGISTASGVLDFFHIQWQRILLERGRRPMFWDEFFFVYDGNPPTRTNLTVLNGTTASVRGISAGGSGEYANDFKQWNMTLAAGIPTISTGISEMWYLDRVGKLCSGHSGNDPTTSYFTYWWQTWHTYYSHDPFKDLPKQTFKNKSLLLGGEVDMWGEGIDDTNFIAHVFPALSASAERMWSAAGSGDLPDVQERLGTHRCSLVRAGLPVPPIGPGPPCGKLRMRDLPASGLRPLDAFV